MRIQRKRTKGWRKSKNSIYVGRGSKWGNPFKVGSYLNAWGKAFLAIKLTDATPESIHKIYHSGIFDTPISLEKSLEWYEIWITFMIKEKKLEINELKGKDLVCWCPLTSQCHADILIKLANE
jgi:hypothetical protein